MRTGRAHHSRGKPKITVAWSAIGLVFVAAGATACKGGESVDIDAGDSPADATTSEDGAQAVDASTKVPVPDAASADLQSTDTQRPFDAASAPGLIGYWRFDEGQGIVAEDSSGSESIGIVVEGTAVAATGHPAPSWTVGKFGGGLELDGVDDWVRVLPTSATDSTNVTHQVTATAWVYIRAINPRRDHNFVLARTQMGTSGNPSYGLGLYLGRPAAVADVFQATTSTDLPLREWTHLAITHDGTFMRVFVNGVQAGELQINVFHEARTAISIGAAIHFDTLQADEFMAGIVDEVRLYNRALPPSEIQALAAP